METFPLKALRSKVAPSFFTAKYPYLARSILLFSSLALFSSCVSNKAAVNPYSYAPKTPNTLWTTTRDVPPSIAEPTDSTPLSLAELLDISLQNNPQTRLTWAKARAAAASYGEAQSPDFPTLNANYNWTRSRSSTTGPGQTAGTAGLTPLGSNSVDPNNIKLQNFFLSQWGPQMQLSYTLLDFGQTRSAAESAKQALHQAGYTHNRQIQTVIQTVTSDYYNYLYQEELQRAKEADLLTAETTFAAAKLGLDAGVKNVSDVLQSQTQVIQTQIQLVTQKQQVVTSLATLLTDMGLKATTSLQLQQIPSIPPIEEMLKSADELLTMALNQRADLLAAEANVKAKQADVVHARRQFYPTLTYNLNFGETTYTNLGSDGYDFTGILSLNFPIFSGFSTLNQLKQAKAMKEEAEASFRQTQLSIIKEITTDYANVKTAFETVKYADEYLQTAKTQYDVSLSRYKAGTGDILEVISSQSTLADARAKQVQATNQWFTSLVTLSYATGALSPPPPPIEKKPSPLSVQINGDLSE